MARALIITPDPQTPGGVSLTELYNLADAWLEDSGVLVVKQTDDADPVHYAPGAWHSWTADNGVRLMPDA
jgi:agmatine/peptidylarginine deiminase